MKKIIISLKTKFNVATGKIFNVKKEIDIPYKWYGNEYGGFYVSDEKLNKDSVIYSFGIGEDISFDEALINKFGCKVFGFDPTPKSIKWIRSRKNPVEFIFSPFGIDEKSGIVEFLLPKKDNYVSGSVINQINVDEDKKIKVNMKCLSDIVKEMDHKYLDILKIDIEGAEYKVLDSILSAPVEIHQILIEIHERFFPDGKEKTKALLDTLHKYGYKIFGVSKGMEELSFIKI
ncbi:FkbM family methyltransferase [Chryseobacterium oranimense]|uniref:FkbM family methyltransferase n=1 Tax=Chryseobacterium oranimense TaxID=421058 RepID=UPI0021AFDCC2|nr:FkbM family methyltransferase [Chryseobacterium oranimense]UWX60782.1 FkbM family methyltransferase [Chryseobacterium oranimense]